MCSKLCITGVRCSFHTLRHSFSVNYLRNGGNLYYLQRILEHSSIVITQTYLRSLGIEDLKAVHEKRCYPSSDGSVYESVRINSMLTLPLSQLLESVDKHWLTTILVCAAFFLLGHLFTKIQALATHLERLSSRIEDLQQTVGKIEGLQRDVSTDLSEIQQGVSECKGILVLQDILREENEAE